MTPIVSLGLGFLKSASVLAFLVGSAQMKTYANAAVYPVEYKTTVVDGVKIFYRESGPKGAPVIFLPHGLPSSSRMFATLIPLLADKYHVIAPA